AGVEREMCDDPGNLRWLDAVFEREIEMVRHLNRLVARDQRGKRDDAAVVGVQARTLPHIAEQTILGVLIEGGSYASDILTAQRRFEVMHGIGLLRLSRASNHDKRCDCGSNDF